MLYGIQAAWVVVLPLSDASSLLAGFIEGEVHQPCARSLPMVGLRPWSGPRPIHRPACDMRQARQPARQPDPPNSKDQVPTASCVARGTSVPSVFDSDDPSKQVDGALKRRKARCRNSKAFQFVSITQIRIDCIVSQAKVNNLDVPTLKKEFKKMLETLSRQTGLSLREVFRDFCEIAAVSISNTVDSQH